jgi:hypothetical protein
MAGEEDKAAAGAAAEGARPPKHKGKVSTSDARFRYTTMLAVVGLSLSLSASSTGIGCACVMLHEPCPASAMRGVKWGVLGLLACHRYTCATLTHYAIGCDTAHL